MFNNVWLAVFRDCNLRSLIIVVKCTVTIFFLTNILYLSMTVYTIIVLAVVWNEVILPNVYN